jgi:hypothetical protein
MSEQDQKQHCERDSDDLIRQRCECLARGSDVARIREVRRPLGDRVLVRLVRGGCDLVRCLLNPVTSVDQRVSSLTARESIAAGRRPSSRGSYRRRVHLCRRHKQESEDLQTLCHAYSSFRFVASAA